MKVNDILATELEKEKNNDAEMSKVNSLEIVKDKDVGHDMILVRNSNRLRWMMSSTRTSSFIRLRKFVRVLTKWLNLCMGVAKGWHEWLCQRPKCGLNQACNVWADYRHGQLGSKYVSRILSRYDMALARKQLMAWLGRWLTSILGKVVMRKSDGLAICGKIELI